jgi:hypothetical protein
MKKFIKNILHILIPNEKLRKRIFGLYHFFFIVSNNKVLLHDIKAVKKQILKSQKDRLFEKLVAGKSVAVVGNGPQEMGKGTGKEIDSHDLVIRFNNFKTAGYEIDYGTRTDIWARNNNIFETKNRENPEQFKMIVWRFDKSYWVHHRELWLIATAQSLAGKAVYGAFPENVIADVHKWLDPAEEVFPTLGALVIKFLVDYTEVKSVDIYGFSFLDAIEDKINLGDHYYDDYSIRGTHDMKTEARLLREMLIGERRVK